VLLDGDVNPSRTLLEGGTPPLKIWEGKKRPKFAAIKYNF